MHSKPMEAFDESGNSADFGTASEPILFIPGIGESKIFAAVMPQSIPGFSPDAGIGAPNHGSSTAPEQENATRSDATKTRDMMYNLSFTCLSEKPSYRTMTVVPYRPLRINSSTESTPLDIRNSSIHPVKPAFDTEDLPIPRQLPFS